MTAAIDDSQSAVGPTVVFDFTDRPLEEMVAGCAEDPLLGLIQAHVPPGGRILEAGAGSGRWLKALAERGYEAVGIELSLPDVERFRARYPEIHLDHGNIERMPYEDGSCDSILSLGVIEHLFQGHDRALREATRVLKPGGVMLITVPHDNFCFRLVQIKNALRFRLLGSNLLRRLLGRPAAPYARDEERQRVARIRKTALPGFAIHFGYSREEGRSFYEYRFTAAQLAAAVERAGLLAEKTFYLYPADRLHELLGGLASHYDGARPLRLTGLGRFITRLLPASWCGHMVLVAARRPLKS
jgi:SAM-dependent methyltransferase